MLQNGKAKTITSQSIFMVLEKKNNLSKADLLHSGLKHKKKKPPKLST
jgi:hypothetical protein